ncbi:MAG: hypothetical protein PHY93_21330 [Bacteriovorax sp.]|nr:hypothetical protein [Bacteriovorax sp.]
MKSFMEKHWASIPPDLNILLEACARSQGKEELWKAQRPEVLESLKKSAIIESSVSSNRMEGIDIDDQRAKELFEGKGSSPIDRGDEEVLGYKEALNWIHTEHESITINIETIKKLHEYCFQGEMSSDAGQFKESNKPIREQLDSGEWIDRFNPVEDVESFLKHIIAKYNDWRAGGSCIVEIAHQ